MVVENFGGAMTCKVENRRVLVICAAGTLRGSQPFTLGDVFFCRDFVIATLLTRSYRRPWRNLSAKAAQNIIKVKKGAETLRYDVRRIRARSVSLKVKPDTSAKAMNVPSEPVNPSAASSDTLVATDCRDFSVTTTGRPFLISAATRSGDKKR